MTLQYFIQWIEHNLAIFLIVRKQYFWSTIHAGAFFPLSPLTTCSMCAYTGSHMVSNYKIYCLILVSFMSVCCMPLPKMMVNPWRVRPVLCFFYTGTWFHANAGDPLPYTLLGRAGLTCETVRPSPPGGNFLKHTINSTSRHLLALSSKETMVSIHTPHAVFRYHYIFYCNSFTFREGR